MKYYNFCRICKTATVTAFLFFAIVFQSCLAQTKPDEPNGYDKASYDAAQQGKFMRTWLVAGPVSIRNDSLDVADSLQAKAFKEDQLSTVDVVSGKPISPVRIKEKDLQWKLVTSDEDAVILDKIYEGKDFAYAYALAEIKAVKPTNVMLGVGSDDGVRLWHNGKLIHDNWIPRGVNKDDDIIPLKLVKGSNQILLKVQDIKGGWSFVVRMLDKAALSDQLSSAAGNGNLDKINSLIEGGADVNAKILPV